MRWDARVSNYCYYMKIRKQNPPVFNQRNTPKNVWFLIYKSKPKGRGKTHVRTSKFSYTYTPYGSPLPPKWKIRKEKENIMRGKGAFWMERRRAKKLLHGLRETIIEILRLLRWNSLQKNMDHIRECQQNWAGFVLKNVSYFKLMCLDWLFRHGIL